MKRSVRYVTNCGAVVSITSNMAEGVGRVLEKDRAHFIEIAYGSLVEVNCQNDYVEELVQVTWNMTEEDTRKREIDGIKEAARGTQCDKLTIVTREQKETIEEDGYRIEVV